MSALSSLRVSGSDAHAERHVLSPVELREALQLWVDTQNAGKPAAECLDIDRLVIAVEPFDRAKLDAKGPQVDTYDPANPTPRQKALDAFWVLPVAPLADPKDGVVGSLQIRKLGKADFYAIRVLDAGGYYAPFAVEQFGTTRPINGSPWGEVGQVVITFSLRGGVLMRPCTGPNGFKTIEAAPSSIAKGQVGPGLAEDGHIAFNPKRIVGLGGVVLVPHLGEDIELALADGQFLMRLGSALRESEDGRFLAAVAKGIGTSRLFALVVVFAILWDLILREADAVRAKLAKKA